MGGPVSCSFSEISVFPCLVDDFPMNAIAGGSSRYLPRFLLSKLNRVELTHFAINLHEVRVFLKYFVAFFNSIIMSNTSAWASVMAWNLCRSACDCKHSEDNDSGNVAECRHWYV